MNWKTNTNIPSIVSCIHFMQRLYIFMTNLYFSHPLQSKMNSQELIQHVKSWQTDKLLECLSVISPMTMGLVISTMFFPVNIW